MPASSPTMLFTWSAESILVGLVAYAVCEPNYLIYAQLALACLTCVLHVVALAAASDSHHSISVSYLCVVTAMLVQDRTGPLESLNSMVTMCAFVVAEVVALGMTFASCEGATALFLHSRGHFALLLGVGLDFVRCWNPFIGGGVVLFIIAAQCAPFASVGLACSIGAAGAFTAWSFLAGSWYQVGAGGVVFLASAGWLLGVWLVQLPELVLPEVVLPSAPPLMSRPPSLMVWPRMRPPLFKEGLSRHKET